jgi:hypothetical protein
MPNGHGETSADYAHAAAERAQEETRKLEQRVQELELAFVDLLKIISLRQDVPDYKNLREWVEKHFR